MHGFTSSAKPGHFWLHVLLFEAYLSLISSGGRKGCVVAGLSSHKMKAKCKVARYRPL